MRLNTWQKMGLAYGGFCIGNLAIAFFTGNYFRTQIQRAPPRQLGDNVLLDFNDTLLAYNLLARLVPQAYGASTPAALMPLNPS